MSYYLHQILKRSTAINKIALNNNIKITKVGKNY